MHTGQGVAETGSAFSGAWKGSETMAKGKYEYWKSHDGLLLIEGWARDGLTDEQIAHNMGITAKTLYEWKNKHGEICEALKKTKEVVDREVENALYKKALSGDTTALIFWLKNRRPNDWRDKRETQLSGSVQTVPDRLVIDYGDNAED
jgi:hypothetical protein